MAGDGYSQLAQALDDAISKGRATRPEPAFLGLAGEIARHLRAGLIEALQHHRAKVLLVAGGITLFASGIALLQSIEAANYATIGVVGYLIKTGLFAGSKSKPRATKSRGGKTGDKPRRGRSARP
jgi:hypothetical protein